MSWLEHASLPPCGEVGRVEAPRWRCCRSRSPPAPAPALSTGGAAGVGPQADLPAIAVDVPVTREEQVFRNALLFALRGGGEGDAPRYDLIYRITIREQEIAVERGTGMPNAYQLTGGVSFLLKDAASGASLFGASVAGERHLCALLAELRQYPRPA